GCSLKRCRPNPGKRESSERRESWRPMQHAPPDFEHLPMEICGEQLLLSPERAVIWPNRSALIVADPHFGKDDVFRPAGIALPRGPAVDDLQRLTRLLEAYQLQRLIVLGDFLHAATRSGDAFLHAFSIWRRAHAALAIDVIAGNHDRREAREK